MARTTDQIRDIILAAVGAEPALAGLTSSSATAIWSQFAAIVASSQQVAEQLGDLQVATMNEIADEAVPGGPDWLQRQAFKYQFGDQIQLNANLTFTYATPDAQKRIITRCAIEQVPVTREVLIKVAKGTVGNLQKLSALELTGFKSYMNKIKFAGTHLLPVSLDADRIVTNYEIKYDGQVPEATFRANLNDAINTFFANIPFNGNIQLSSLEDAIQKVPGYLDFVRGATVARPATVALNDPSLQPIQSVYSTQAGYVVAETAPGSTLTDTIILTPQ